MCFNCIAFGLYKLNTRPEREPRTANESWILQIDVCVLREMSKHVSLLQCLYCKAFFA